MRRQRAAQRQKFQVARVPAFTTGSRGDTEMRVVRVGSTVPLDLVSAQPAVESTDEAAQQIADRE
jgi:hypothetical protein